MTVATKSAGAAPAICDFALVRAPQLDAAEAGLALGLAHALRLAGFEVDEHGASAARVKILVGDLVHATEALSQSGSSDRSATIVVPLVRGADEVSGWREVGQRMAALWTPAPALAASLNGDGVTAQWIGASCQLGAVRHHSRRALELREGDFVFAAHLAGGSARAESAGVTETLRSALTELNGAHQTRFAKASLLVTVADEAAQRDWETFATELRSDAIVVRRRGNDPLLLASMIALSDCELFCGAGSAFPWTAACALFAGKPVIALAEPAPGVFGDTDPAQLHRVPPSDAAAIARLLAELPGGRAGAGAASAVGAAAMLLQCSARAVAVRIVAALRSLDLWDGLALSDTQ